MTTPINLGQPSIALPQSLVVGGQYPIFGGGVGWNTSSSMGFILTTAFEYDASDIKELVQAKGQNLKITDYTGAFSLLGSTYGSGATDSEFRLPDLQGAAPIYRTNDDGLTLWGQTQGTPTNSVVLDQAELPTTLGGTMWPIDNLQHGLGVQYLIQVDGSFPGGDGPSNDTLGMVYPFASPHAGGIPTGFLPADGRLLEINDYQMLAALLKANYGGDGVTTFALPDLTNRVPVGTGERDGSNIWLGREFGADEVVLLEENVSGDQPLSTAQPSLGMHYVVNTTGLFKSLDTFDPMIGQISLYAGSYVPSGWTLAQGQTVPVSDNSTLFALYRDTFGGDGTTTYALPDLRGRTVVGTGGEQNLSLGDTQGTFVQPIQMENLPEIVVPVPGVHMVDESGRTITGEITGKFEIDVSGVMPQARVEYSVDNQNWSTTFEPKEGDNTLYVRQVNTLGQASAATNPIRFVLDTSAPTAPEVVINDVTAEQADSRATAYYFAPTMSDEEIKNIPRTTSGKLTFSDVEDGARIEFSIDGGQTWSDSFEAEEGVNALRMRQVDAAGNVSPATDIIGFHWEGSDTTPAVTSTDTHGTGGHAITVTEHGALSVGMGTEHVDLLIHGHQQDVFLPQDIEHVRLTEDGLNNVVTGNAHDNVFEVAMGNWVIEGGSGHDTVKLSHALSDYVMSQESHEGHLQATLYGLEGKIVVRDVETIVFSDTRLSKTGGEHVSQIDHLYEELLGRMPDAEGLTFWLQQMSQGASLGDVAQGFAESAEFLRLYGMPSDEHLVQEMYEAILGRSPDAEGSAYWVQALMVHDLTEGELISNLLLSDESHMASRHQVTVDGLFVMG